MISHGQAACLREVVGLIAPILAPPLQAVLRRKKDRPCAHQLLARLTERCALRHTRSADEPITLSPYSRQGRSGGMRSRADIYRQKADECERAAARVANPQVQASYRQMSRQWHEMAERQQTIVEAFGSRRKPVE
jgi:hypothetical protein